MKSRLLEPDLLTPESLAQARVFALEDAGLLAGDPPDEGTLRARSEEAGEILEDGPALGEWRRAVAAELFLLSQWDLARAKSLAEAAGLLNDNPLPGAPPLRAAFGTRAACATAPLDAPSGVPLLQVWALQTGDVDQQWAGVECGLDDFDGWGRRGYRLGAVPPVFGRKANWPKGSSWKLAAVLAGQALHEPGPENKWIRTLACDWIITGDVAGDEVGLVGLGNKPRAAKEDARRRRRRWLAPAVCSGTDAFDDLSAHLPGRLSAVADLREAWAYVTGSGLIVADRPGPWPDEPCDFHAFLSPALGPIVAPLLLQPAGRAVFWVSNEMEYLWPAVQEFVRMAQDHGVISTGLTLAQPREVKTASIEEAEASLLLFPDLMSAGDPVVFNITGGNIPPRLAIAELARGNPNLQLIYRPESREQSSHYLGLNYPRLLPRTRRLDPRDARADDLINLRLPKLAKDWDCKSEKAFLRWCRENLPRIAARFSQAEPEKAATPGLREFESPMDATRR